MFQKAVKHQAKLKLALCGLAGSGKTFSALAIASAISALIRKHGHGDGRIAVVDSEKGSAKLYADRFDFDVCELETFSPLAYVEAIQAAERDGYDIIVTDSLSHAWAGKDGALDQKDRASATGGNSWTAWRNVTPKHNSLVDALVGSKAHIIATMRQKMEYVQETNDRGKVEIKKVGLAAIQREGMEYEFTVVGDLDLTHTLKISKTRVAGIDIGDQFEKPGAAFAERVYGWLMSGEKPRERVAATAPPSPPANYITHEPAPDPVTTALDEAFAAYLAGIAAATTLEELDKAAKGPGAPIKGDPMRDWAGKKYKERKAWIVGQMADAEAKAKQAEDQAVVDDLVNLAETVEADGAA